MSYEFIAVDIQNEFASKGGVFYSPKPSIKFLHSTLFPFLKEQGKRINEIVSDYRQPRSGDTGDGCHPGTWGYESLLPYELRKSVWVKSMNSPIWIRENGGDGTEKPGEPYPDSLQFGEWISCNIGSVATTTPVLFGLTIDCCVLSVVQEFRWRGFEPVIIREAVDHSSGLDSDRDIVLEKTALSWWSKVVDWDAFKGNLGPET